MRLVDILKDLTYGELSDLHIGNLIPGEGDNEPDPHQYEQIVGYINLGLKELYKRFYLKSREIYIELQDELSVYKLSSDYAQANTASAIPEADRYIADSVDSPFLDDLLKIECVFDEAGAQIALNDHDDENSIFTPTYRSLQVPYPATGTTLAVQYRAAPDKIIATPATEAADVEVELPNSLHDALLYYVGSRAHRATDMEKSADYWQMFKKSCDDVDNYGLEIQPETSNHRFDQNGWV